MTSTSLYTLGDTAEFINGLGFKQTDWHGEGTPIIRIQNLTDHTKPFNLTNREVPEKYHVDNGDILVSWSATLDAFVWNRGPAYLNQHIFKVIPNLDIIQPKFLFYLLKFEIKALSQRAHGSTMKHINRGPFLAHPVYVPPLIEQQAIVDEIETQFARLDDAEAALRRSEVRLEKLGAAYRELVFTSGEGATWPIQSMKSLVTNIEAGKSYKCEERPPEKGETGTVKVSAVTWEEFDELESKTCLDESRVDERLLIEPGQFLFSRANTIELVGRAVITATVTRRLMLSDKIWRVTFNDYVDPRWVLHFLRSYSGRHQIESRATGNQLSMRNISQNNFKAISLPVPDRSIQSERITTLETALEKIERQSSAVSISLRQINHLRQAILKNAFEGTHGQ